MLVALIVAGVAGYWGYDQYQDRQQLEVYMGNKYQESFYELVEHVEQLQVLIGKSLVSTSPQQNIMILTDVWSHSNTAQSELNKLPLAAQTVYDTAKFLSQTGDFAHVMARKNTNGQVLSSEERKSLNQLRQHSISIAESLHRVENEVLAGKVNWTELVRNAKQELKAEERETPDNVKLDDVRDEMTKVPTLIYDGPFSDHITERKPQELKGAVLSKENAREKAKKYIDDKNAENIQVSEGTNVNGRVPSFNFQVETGNDVYSVNVAKKGGFLVSLLNNRDIVSAKISMDTAVDKAEDYLASIGYRNMQPTFSEIKENVAYISFAYKRDNIVYYTDLINLQVAMDDGQILAVEALNYLMSHHEREIGKAEISEDVAREMATATLEEIESVRLAVIPSPGLEEILTYEVRGTSGTETYLIYINAKSGNEEQILKVIMGDQGTFAL
ncbi:MAG: germination protein YpeB [Halanaerobiaceae bacterium]